MRRTAAVVLTLALAVLGAPAIAASSGTVVIVTSGPAVGTVTLPAKGRLDFWDATYDTASPYAVITATKGGEDIGYAGHFPGFRYRHDTFFGELQGRVTLRVLTSGKTTITVPGQGFSGRRVYRLTSRLRGATAKFAPADVLGSAARNVLPFTTAAESHVFHGYTAGWPVAYGEVYSLCLSERDEACPALVPDVQQSTILGAHMVHRQMPGGARDSHLTAVALGVFLDPVTHYVLTVPLT